MDRLEELEHLEHQGHLRDAARAAQGLGLQRRAAQLYERAGQHLEAARAWREERMFKEALEAVLRVPSADPQYRTAARLAIGLAANLRRMTQELEAFLAPYTEQLPTSLDDRDALFLLGQLYEVLEYSNHARDLFERVARSDHLHPVHAHLRAIDQRANANSTFESRPSRQDLHELRKRVAVLVGNSQQSGLVQPGSVLAGRYRVLRPLGEGASASVHAVLDTELDEEVALKLFTHAEDDALREARFRREVSLARKLVHKNIVRIFELGRHGERRLLTMELLDGRDLRALIDEGGTLDDRQKLELVLQALEGLAYAHANRVVHRDIKPENLFVTSAGVLKIADFGIAKRAEDRSITVSGTMGGTPYYVSPEQIMNLRDADQRSDLYSLGVVAYELFALQRPFESENLTALLLMHLQHTPVPLRVQRPVLPAALDQIILKLLAKQRDQRFQDSQQVSEALRAVTF